MPQMKLHLFIDSDDTFPGHADVILPQAIVKKWRIALHGPVTLLCGSSAMDARILYSRNNSQKLTVRLRRTVAHVLGIYSECRMNIRYTPQHRLLQFGPLLGILTDGIEKRTSHEQRFGGMTRFYTECHLSADAHGIRMFVFSPEDLNVQKKQINGWTYLRGQWKQVPHPLPDVIYNRITSRRIEAQRSLQQKLELLKRLHRVQLFNEQFLDKWQVHTALKNDPSVRFMLPETHLYAKWTQLKSLLRRYPVVYIKPAGGSLGQGVMRLTLTGTRCHMQYTTLNGTITRSNVSFQEIARHMAWRKRHYQYLIQQGLPLITSLGRSIDFRVLVQKNGQGKWSITSIAGRIASDTNIVSNLARGGTIGTVSHILKQVDPGQPKPTIPQLRQHALAIAHAFERQIHGHFAELGIDLAADKSGKIWLLEINSKPSKTDDSVTNPSNDIRPSVGKTMDYTCCITGFPQKARKK